MDSMCQMLFTYREKRISPHRDEKILTSWNGLMIASLAYAGRVFNNEFYIKTAKKSKSLRPNSLSYEEVPT